MSNSMVAGIKTANSDEERIRATLEDAIDRAALVAITDRDGKITYVNRRFCEVSKFSPEELVGKTHQVVSSGRHPKEFWESFWSTITSGATWEGEIQDRAKDGTLYWLHTTIVPSGDQFVAIRYLTTERKEIEAQLLRQDRLASIGLLASSLAHEIGTPLGVIRGRAEYLEMMLETARSAANQDPARKSLSIIIDQIDRISKLIKLLLQLARGEATELAGPVEVRPVVTQVQALVGHELDSQSIELAMEIPDSASVKAEAAPLEQVFLNLVMNAIQAIDEARKDEGAARPPGRITVRAREVKATLEITIEDNGCGIPEENVGHLFKPFFTTKDIGVGTGLGLATAYRIVQSWGGSILVKSRVGEGSAFTIVLPRA